MGQWGPEGASEGAKFLWREPRLKGRQIILFLYFLFLHRPKGDKKSLTTADDL